MLWMALALVASWSKWVWNWLEIYEQLVWTPSLTSTSPGLVAGSALIRKARWPGRKSSPTVESSGSCMADGGELIIHSFNASKSIRALLTATSNVSAVGCWKNASTSEDICATKDTVLLCVCRCSSGSKSTARRRLFTAYLQVVIAPKGFWQFSESPASQPRTSGCSAANTAAFAKGMKNSSAPANIAACTTQAARNVEAWAMAQVCSSMLK